MNYSVEQIEIINHESGHAMVMACPGTGKTTTMVGRILELLHRGVNPNRMTILMFGNSAQSDFSKKLKDSVSEIACSLPEVRTYHSLAFHLCKFLMQRNEMPKYELETSNKRLEMLALDALKQTVGAQSFKNMQSQNGKIVEMFVSFIDNIKASLGESNDVFEKMGLHESLECFVPAFIKFEELRNKNKIRFFSDLLYDLVTLLLKRDDLCALFANKKDYIIVDEYQDTNLCQSTLLKIIAGTRAEVMVVGDVDQAIYEWRGGDPKLMLIQFEKDFPNTKYYSLSYTFRYGQELALIANELITKNKLRHQVVCKPFFENKSTNTQIIGSINTGDSVIDIINNGLKNNLELKDIAILVRLYSQAAPIELALIRNKIPYKMYGGKSFLYSKEVECMTYILELAAGVFKTLSEAEKKERFLSILKFPHLGLPSDILEKIAAHMASKQSCFAIDNNPSYYSRLSAYQKEKIQDRFDLLMDIEYASNEKASRILKKYINYSNLRDGVISLALSDMEATETIERYESFYLFIKENDDNPKNIVELIKNLCSQEKDLSNKDDFITISSIHRSKGLEWKSVILPGLIEGKFPYQSNNGAITNIESERRLFYVGMTRAVESLYIIAPKTKELELFISGSNSSNRSYPINKASRFIFETNYLASKSIARKKLGTAA